MNDKEWCHIIPAESGWSVREDGVIEWSEVVAWAILPIEADSLDDLVGDGESLRMAIPITPRASADDLRYEQKG